jgi:hypothetical protein
MTAVLPFVWHGYGTLLAFATAARPPQCEPLARQVSVIPVDGKIMMTMPGGVGDVVSRCGSVPVAPAGTEHRSGN